MSDTHRTQYRSDACTFCTSICLYPYYRLSSPRLSQASLLQSPVQSSHSHSYRLFQYCSFGSGLLCLLCCEYTTQMGLYELINIMLNPLRNLKGKLNHIRLPQTHMFRAIHIANSIPGNGKSLTQDESISVDDILALKSDTDSIPQRRFHRFQFQYMVHSQNSAFGLSSTVLDELSAHERKVSHTVCAFAGELNMRQQMYLNLAIRQRINSEYPDWQKLHFSPESPFKVQMEVFPSLTSASRLPELKGLEKKGVMSEVVKAKEG